MMETEMRKPFTSSWFNDCECHTRMKVKTKYLHYY